MPAALRRVVSRALETFPAALRLTPQDLQQQQQQRQPAGAADEEVSVAPAVAATAQALLEHVLGCCMQVGLGLFEERLLRGGGAGLIPLSASGAKAQQQHRDIVQAHTHWPVPPPSLSRWGT
mgnify:CR=1 FL=1